MWPERNRISPLKPVFVICLLSFSLPKPHLSPLFIDRLSLPQPQHTSLLSQFRFTLSSLPLFPPKPNDPIITHAHAIQNSMKFLCLFKVWHLHLPCQVRLLCLPANTKTLIWFMFMCMCVWVGYQ